MRFLSLLGLLACLGTSLPAASPTVEDVHRMISERAFDEMDKALNNANAAFAAGDITEQEIRRLYFALSRSHPSTTQFLKDWLDHDPQNPKAQVSRAWSLFNRAPHVASGGNQQSQEAAREMRREARRLFSFSYQTAPTLLPASDAIVRGIVRGEPGIPEERQALYQILETHPNWGSASRYLMTHGFVLEQQANLECLDIASRFPKAQRALTNHRCLIQVGSRQGFPRLGAYIEEHLTSDTDPETTIDRFDYFLEHIPPHTWTPAQVDWAIDTASNHPFTPHQMVILDLRLQHLNLMLQAQDRFPAVDLHMKFRKARLAEAMQLLKHDPFNIPLIDMVAPTAFAPETKYERVGPGKFKTTIVDPDRTAEEQAAFDAAKKAHEMEMAYNRLGASPYQSDNWMSYALRARRASEPYSYFDGYPAIHNAIVYAWDPAQYLQIMLGKHRDDYYTVRALRNVDMSTIPQQNFALFSARTSWANSVDLDAQIVCPYARAMRIYEAICQQYPDGAMQCDASMINAPDFSADLDQLAQTAQACEDIRNAPIEDLWYTITPY